MCEVDRSQTSRDEELWNRVGWGETQKRLEEPLKASGAEGEKVAGVKGRGRGLVTATRFCGLLLPMPVYFSHFVNKASHTAGRVCART